MTPPRGVEDAAPYTDSMLVLGRFVGAGHAINKNPGTLIPCVPGKVFSAYCSCAANSCGAAL